MAVSMPVDSTRPTPAPEDMPVPEKAIFRRSARGASSGQTTSASFSTGTDSPVRADSSAISSTDRSSRRSAGTRSPVRSSTMSPGTSSALSIVSFFPARMTLAFGELSFFSASMALSARSSWTVPITAFIMTMDSMIMGSRKSASPCMAEAQKDTPALTSRISTIKSLNCPRKRMSTLWRRAGRSWFLPCSERRRAASAGERPRSGSVDRAFTASRTVALWSGM